MITIGKKAPDFKAQAVVKNQISDVTLADYTSHYKLLFFYPLNFTFVCPTEMHALQETLTEFVKRDVEVIGVSVDSVHSHLAWLNTPREKGGIQGVQYTLISDIHKNMARDYGVLDEQEGVALRGVFLIDRDDVVQYAAVHNLPLGRNVNEILRVIDALQHVEKNGVVCPANWTPGDKDMVPTNKGLKEYFAG